MGYHPTPKLVHEWAGHLEVILQYVKGEKQEPLLIKVPEPAMLYRTQYTLRRALKAANVFTDEKAGRYEGLDEHIKIGVDDKQCCIVITKTSQPAIEVQQNTRDERNVLQRMDSIAPNQEMFLDHFHPSPNYNEASFREEIETRGWDVRTLIHHGESDELLLNCIREVDPAINDSPVNWFKKARQK